MAGQNQKRQLRQRSERLGQVLAKLAEQGVTQRQAAIELNVPAQYLSDVKNAHRPLTEQFARRIAEQYGVSFAWLMGGVGQMAAPQLNRPATLDADVVVLPVLTDLTGDEPTESEAWDGSRLKISGAAAVASARATCPYVLRFASNDVDGRLRQRDLILVSQDTTGSFEIAVVKHRGRLALARRDANAKWKLITTGQPLPEKVQPVGQCLGIVWAPL